MRSSCMGSALYVLLLAIIPCSATAARTLRSPRVKHLHEAPRKKHLIHEKKLPTDKVAPAANLTAEVVQEGNKTALKALKEATFEEKHEHILAKGKYANASAGYSMEDADLQQAKAARDIAQATGFEAGRQAAELTVEEQEETLHEEGHKVDAAAAAFQEEKHEHLTMEHALHAAKTAAAKQEGGTAEDAEEQAQDAKQEAEVEAAEVEKQDEQEEGQAEGQEEKQQEVAEEKAQQQEEEKEEEQEKQEKQQEQQEGQEEGAEEQEEEGGGSEEDEPPPEP